ncbi:MAG: DUF1294 domain-containing protein [Fimbriimonadaceae bacterium]
MEGQRFQGTIAVWKDDRGFGFIRPDADPEDSLFFHIKQLRAFGRRPAEGDRVTFSLERQDTGKMRAVEVYFEGYEPKSPPNGKPESRLPQSLAAAVCLGFSVVVGLAAGTPLLMLLYPVAGVVTYITYWIDKSNAQSGGWRVSELKLHTMELLGGWPGALIAQKTMRHKTSKADYQVVFNAIVILHVLTWLGAAGAMMGRS